MSVSEILAEKGNSVVTTSQDQTLMEVANILADKKIGATIVVDSKNDVCGIASERDIIRHIAADGSEALKKPIGVCMTQNVVSCELSETIDGVMEKMTAGRFRHLPVIENGALLGIVSIGDVVKRKIQMAEHDAEELKRYIAG